MVTCDIQNLLEQVLLAASVLTQDQGRYSRLLEGLITQVSFDPLQCNIGIIMPPHNTQILYFYNSFNNINNH